MKTRFALILIALLAAATVSCVNSHAGDRPDKPEPQITRPDTSHLCPITARITGLDRESDIVTIQMANGHVFRYYGCSDYEIGDYVSAIVWDPTGYSRDYEIVSVHYSGYSDYAGDNLG